MVEDILQSEWEVRNREDPHAVAVSKYNIIIAHVLRYFWKLYLYFNEHALILKVTKFTPCENLCAYGIDLCIWIHMFIFFNASWGRFGLWHVAN